jgi:hypothetical protein
VQLSNELLSPQEWEEVLGLALKKRRDQYQPVAGHITLQQALPPKMVALLQKIDISMLVPCMRLNIAVSPLARRYASTVGATVWLPRVSTIYVYSSLTVI